MAVCDVVDEAQETTIAAWETHCKALIVLRNGSVIPAYVKPRTVLKSWTEGLFIEQIEQAQESPGTRNDLAGLVNGIWWLLPNAVPLELLDEGQYSIVSTAVDMFVAEQRRPVFRVSENP